MTNDAIKFIRLLSKTFLKRILEESMVTLKVLDPVSPLGNMT